jgi:hypothetical protein
MNERKQGRYGFHTSSILAEAKLFATSLPSLAQSLVKYLPKPRRKAVQESDTPQAAGFVFGLVRL